MPWDEPLGRAMRLVEQTFTAGWSVGEVAYGLRHPLHLVHDPYRERVLGEIQEKGLYQEFAGEERRLLAREDGLIVAPNPYVRIGRGPQDKIVAQLKHPQRPRARRLLVVCHCYGLPIPALMERLFGLGDLDGYDVVYNIMNHHYLGSFTAWPGFGFMSIQVSQMIENLRSAFVGLRSLARSLQATYGYERVSLLGYSIGGQLSLHVANCLPLDRLLLYCPVISLRQTVEQLGLMPWMGDWVKAAMRRTRGDFRLEDLDAVDPLRHTLKLDPARALLIAQTLDAMVDVSQVSLLRARYPSLPVLEAPGTHVWPAHLAAFHRALRQRLLDPAP